MPVEASLAVVEGCIAVTSTLADGCLAEPQQFWSFFSIFGAACSNAEEELFPALCSLLMSVGHTMVSMDAETTQGLLLDYAVPKLIPMLKSKPSFRAALLRVLYGYLVEDRSAHISFIKGLLDGLCNQNVFIHCLSITISFEEVR